jgi:hypothetical protein
MFYSFGELEFIKSRIVDAAHRLGVELSQEVVERDAKLFAAGSYPDRGIEVTESDLDRIVEAHRPVPIKIEHTDSPLELGTVTKLWRVGKDLFGKLAFTSPAWSLLVSSGARKLSAAIKRDKSGLTEVSLVRRSRVADAAVFGGDVTEFDFSIDEGIADETSRTAHSGAVSLTAMERKMPTGIFRGGNSMSDTQTAEFSKRIADLERQIVSKEVDLQVDSLKRAGKLVPAAEEFARALLSAGESQSVTFADGTEKPVAETFAAFLEAQPKIVEFSELAKGGGEAVDMSDAERELCAKLGISPETVVKHRAR